MARDYMEELRQKGKERQRLTDQLVDIISHEANELAYTVPVGTGCTVNDERYEIIEIRSNVGYEWFLAVEDEEGYWQTFAQDTTIGSGYYLHGDFGAYVAVADRDAWLKLANDLPDVIKAFGAEEQKVIARLRAAFDRLKALT